MTHYGTPWSRILTPFVCVTRQLLACCLTTISIVIGVHGLMILIHISRVPSSAKSFHRSAWNNVRWKLLEVHSRWLRNCCDRWLLEGVRRHYVRRLLEKDGRVAATLPLDVSLRHRPPPHNDGMVDRPEPWLLISIAVVTFYGKTTEKM